jgi:hypothetical protein
MHMQMSETYEQREKENKQARTLTNLYKNTEREREGDSAPAAAREER